MYHCTSPPPPPLPSLRIRQSIRQTNKQAPVKMLTNGPLLTFAARRGSINTQISCCCCCFYYCCCCLTICTKYEFLDKVAYYVPPKIVTYYSQTHQERFVYYVVIQQQQSPWIHFIRERFVRSLTSWVSVDPQYTGRVRSFIDTMDLCGPTT